MFEKAKWISKGTKRDDGSRLFRKSINIEKAVKKAVRTAVLRKTCHNGTVFKQFLLQK
jgi:hypothetical protein